MLLKDLKQITCYTLQELVAKVVELQEKGLHVQPDACQKIGANYYIVMYHEEIAPEKEVLEIDKDYLKSLVEMEDSTEAKDSLIRYAEGFGVEEDFFDRRKGVKKLVDSFVGKYHSQKSK